MEFTQKADFRKNYRKKRVLPVVTLTLPIRNTETIARIREILENEWPEITDGFVTTFEYDEAWALKEQILATNNGFKLSHFGTSLLKLNSALEVRVPYLISEDEVRNNFMGAP